MLKIRKIRNNVIREKINIKNSVLVYITYKQQNWYGYVRIMNEERLPQHILELCPPGRRRRRKGRPRNLWIQELTTGMREKGINNMEWVEREEWRRERHRKMCKLCIQINKILDKSNSVHEEIKCRVKAGSSCYYSVQTLLSSIPNFSIIVPIITRRS